MTIYKVVQCVLLIIKKQQFYDFFNFCEKLKIIYHVNMVRKVKKTVTKNFKKLTGKINTDI